MAKPFFDFTLQATNRITELFDLVHPISISYWNMKCSVIGTNELLPVTQKLYNERYNTGNIVHGVNFKKSFIELSWNDFQNKLSWLLLNSLFSIYEGYLKIIKDKFSLTENDIKNLQFPTGVTSSGHPCGYQNTILNILSTNSSSIMIDCFYPKYTSSKNYPTASIENLLLCYRYFKELRNCYIHNNLVASQKLRDAYDEYLPVKNLLNIKKELVISEPIVGNTTQAFLYGVIGFSEIILRIIYHLDAELLKTQQGEEYFKSIINQNHKKKGEQFSSDISKRENQIKRFCAGIGFMHPDNCEELYSFLLTNNLHN